MPHTTQLLRDRFAFLFRAYFPSVMAMGGATAFAHFDIGRFVPGWHFAYQPPANPNNLIALLLNFVVFLIAHMAAWWWTDLLVTNKHPQYSLSDIGVYFSCSSVWFCASLIATCLFHEFGWLVVGSICGAFQFIAISIVLLGDNGYYKFSNTVLQQIYQDRNVERTARIQRQQQRKTQRQQQQLQRNSRRQERERRRNDERRRKQMLEQSVENTETQLQRHLRQLKTDCDERIKAVKEVGFPEDEEEALIADINDETKQRMKDAVVESEDEVWPVRRS